MLNVQKTLISKIYKMYQNTDSSLNKHKTDKLYSTIVPTQVDSGAV